MKSHEIIVKLYITRRTNKLARRALEILKKKPRSESCVQKIQVHSSAPKDSVYINFFLYSLDFARKWVAWCCMFLTKYHNNFLSIVGKNNIRLKNQLKNPQKMNQHKFIKSRWVLGGGEFFSRFPISTQVVCWSKIQSASPYQPSSWGPNWSGQSVVNEGSSPCHRNKGKDLTTNEMGG